MNNRLNNLGLCSKAKGLIVGEEFVCEGIKKKKVVLVFLANDAGPNTTKKVLEKADYYNVLVDTSFSSDEISKAIGRQNRKVVGITNQGFAKLLKK